MGVVVVVSKSGLSCQSLVKSLVAFSHPDFSSRWDPSTRFLFEVVSLSLWNTLSVVFLSTLNFLWGGMTAIHVALKIYLFHRGIFHFKSKNLVNAAGL